MRVIKIDYANNETFYVNYSPKKRNNYKEIRSFQFIPIRKGRMIQSLKINQLSVVELDEAQIKAAKCSIGWMVEEENEEQATDNFKEEKIDVNKMKDFLLGKLK